MYYIYVLQQQKSCRRPEPAQRQPVRGWEDGTPAGKAAHSDWQAVLIPCRHQGDELAAVSWHIITTVSVRAQCSQPFCSLRLNAGASIRGRG